MIDGAGVASATPLMRGGLTAACCNVLTLSGLWHVTELLALVGAIGDDSL